MSELYIDINDNFYIILEDTIYYIQENDTVELLWPTGECNQTKIFIEDNKFALYIYHAGVILTIPLLQLLLLQRKNSIKVFPIIQNGLNCKINSAKT